MQHFTPTTKRRRRLRRTVLTIVALVILGIVLFLQFGRSFMGMTLPGWCSVPSPDGNGVVRVVHGEAEAMVREALESDESVGRAAISCSYAPAVGTTDLTLNKRGLTASAQRMDEAVREIFGRIPDGGYEPGGVTTGHIPGSAHYEGRAIDYFFRPYTDNKQKSHGWLLAQWAVVHAEELDISTIIFDDMIWFRNSSGRGWQKYVHPSGNTTNPILRHLDHVHIDVR